GSKLEPAHAEEPSHMFFGNGMGESFFHMMDTHPPLAERIRAIDPSFDGAFPPVAFTEVDRVPPRLSPPPQRSTLPFPFPGLPRAQAGMAGLAPPMIAAPAMMTSTGTPTSAHLRYAEGLRVSIPASLQSAAREGLGASTLVYALLLSDDEATRAKQLDELAAATSDAVRQETLRVLPEVQTVATHAKLPLVDLAIPGLRHLSPTQFQQFRAAVQKLVESDGEI